MDDNTEGRLLSDVTKLRIMVSRLTALGVANTSALLKLSLVLAEGEGLPTETRQQAVEVFKGMDEQMEILQELSEIMKTNDGR